MANSSNRLVGALTANERAGLEVLLEPVELTSGETLYEAGEPIRTVWLPTTCVVSLVQSFASGATVETATVGCEGFVCVRVALAGADKAAMRHVVQIGGGALRIARPDFIAAFERLPGLRRLVLGYVSGLVHTAMLSVACNRVHDVGQRLARWLLMTHDRSVGNVLPLTHDILGDMLGTHRPTVTRAVGDLRLAGLIDSRRGEIVIIDRPGLEAAACECWRIQAGGSEC